MYILFFRDFADSSGVMSSMTGINDDNKIFGPCTTDTKRRVEQYKADEYI